MEKSLAISRKHAGASVYRGRSHLTDQQEFYQLLEYTDDINITKRLKEWEDFYNYHRPNFELKEKTPYEVLREKLVPQ